MKKTLLIAFLIFHSLASVWGQSAIVKEFMPVCDSLNILIQNRTTVKNELKLQAVMKRGSTLDFYFTESLSDLPWHEGDMEWFTCIANRNLMSGLFASHDFS